MTKRFSQVVITIAVALLLAFSTLPASATPTEPAQSPTELTILLDWFTNLWDMLVASTPDADSQDSPEPAPPAGGDGSEEPECDQVDDCGQTEAFPGYDPVG